MFLSNEMKIFKRNNYLKIKELIRISFGLGVNLTSPTFFKESMRIINLILVLGSGFFLYGHWCFTIRYMDDITKIAESICTAFQVILSIIKMLYYLFIQRKLHTLLEQAQSHEILLKTEIFNTDLAIKKKLKEIMNQIMEKSWKNIRYQLLFYICSCSAIISTYFFTALFVNLYHAVKETPNYKHMLPYPSVFPMWESKGMSFPYYHIQMLCGGFSNYIAGMGAVSFDGVFIVLVVHGVGLLQSLNAMIKNSTSPDVPKERRVEYLRYCILLYQRIQDYIFTINAIYRHISLSQFLLSLIVWGIVLFEISVGLESDKTTFIRMILFLSAAGYEVVIYCFNSQRLTTEYEKIPFTFYSCEWYNETQEFKQLIRMMILRSNRIFNLKVSWFANMTLTTFLEMVRTSGSYFLLLRNLAEE